MTARPAKMDSAPVVLSRDQAQAAKWRIREIDRLSAWLLVVIGFAFVAVGLVDLGIVWTPPRFGNPTWEFGTLTQTFMNVPMTGLGLLLVVLGLIRHPRRGGIMARIAAIVFALVTLVVLTMGVLYITVVPEIVRQTAPEGLDALGRVLIKTATEVIVYPLAFGAISLLLWRSVQRQETP